MTAGVYVLSCRLTFGPLWLRIFLFLWWFLLALFGLFVLHWRYELPCQDKLPEFNYTSIVGCTRVSWLVLHPLGLELDKALFGWNSVKDITSLDGEKDNNDSSTTPDAVIDDGSTREQEEDNKHSSTNQDNEHSSTNQDNEHSSTTQLSSLDEEQDNEDSSTTPEAVIDDESTREQEEDNENSSTNQDNKHSSTNQSSWDDDENESGNDEEYEAVSSDDESEAVRSEEDDNENEEQVEIEDDFGAQQVGEGCSGSTKKRRRFTLQEKLMYLRVVRRKVDKGISLQEASKSINISHKQILDWKKQSEKMKGKSNQHANHWVMVFNHFSLCILTDCFLLFSR